MWWQRRLDLLNAWFDVMWDQEPACRTFGLLTQPPHGCRQDGGAAGSADSTAADADLIKLMFGSVRGRLFKNVPRLDDIDFDNDSSGATAE